ncbi:MAG TPA: ABC transporter ATP-binding protein, partial [Gemmatales bacterium]|nr:ABC transporter ATP-binding protein [Gemmatales bacterium]
LIRTLLGLITIDSGTGTILGHDIKREALTIRQKVGFVPEDECLFPGTVGIEFVAYAGELGGMASTDAMQRAHEVLDYVGLSEQRYRPTDSYSTGMKQRLKLAAALVHDPKLLIMDEPTNGMDPPGREELIALCQDLCQNKGISLLYSSHLLPDVEAVCDYIIVMSQGKVITQGKLAELKKVQQQAFEVRVKLEQLRFSEKLTEWGCTVKPTEDALLVTLPEGQQEGMFWELAAREGFQIRHLRPRRSTLEEVFLTAIQQ